MLPDSDAQGLYQYVGSLTRPIRYHSGTVVHTPSVGADRIRPYRVSCKIGACATLKISRFLSGIVTGRVRELPYRYKPRGSTKKFLLYIKRKSDIMGQSYSSISQENGGFQYVRKESPPGAGRSRRSR